MSKKIFLKEGQIKLLKEYNCPDIVFLGHKTLKYTDNDAVTFFLHPIYGFCADSHITHSELIDDIIVRYMNIGFDYYTSFEKALEKEFEPEECRQLIDEFNELQDEFMSVEHITGRYWSNHDIISFWAKLPDEKSFNVIINELKLDMSTLRIVLEYKIVNANEIYDKSDSEFIFNDKKQEQAKALHLMNAEEKANSPQMQDYLHNRSENIGKKLSYSNNGEMPMAQYRALHTTSESVEKDKYILGDEGCGNFDYTHIQESFGDRTNAFDFIDTPLMLQILKQLKGEDFMKQEGLIENIQYEVKPEEVDLSSFEKKKQLNPQIWKNENTIDSKVRLQLLDIADDFYDSLEVSFANPRDIILTGSICNYNWSDKSDIDLHIVLDFKEISDNTSLLEDYFNTKKNEWNQNHQNLQIFGFNVEVYVEDINAHKVSNGVYSLEKNKWIKKPNFDEVDDIKPMFQDLKILSSKLMTCIDDLKDEFNRTNDLKSIEDIRDTLDYIWDFIKIMRKESLNREGEYSKGNVIYKILRRNGYLDQIFSLSNDIYDKLNSIS